MSKEDKNYIVFAEDSTAMMQESLIQQSNPLTKKRAIEFSERIKNNSLHNNLHCVTILKRVNKEELTKNKEDSFEFDGVDQGFTIAEWMLIEDKYHHITITLEWLPNGKLNYKIHLDGELVSDNGVPINQNKEYGKKMNRCITLFDELTDGERIIVMDGYNPSNGKKELDLLGRNITQNKEDEV